MNRQKLIRELARAADVSRAEAADAVDELAHRLLLAMRRIEGADATTTAEGGSAGQLRDSKTRAKRTERTRKEGGR
ncbi:MAG: hypothetical protein LC114_04530 [Bryobacterales bacterium]|nr:hypothetical protein [Bryobacterales bacterium]